MTVAGWVCPECGLDYNTIKPLDAIAAIRSFPRRYRAALSTFGRDEDPDSVLRRRPAPDVWSALEYAAHVADVIDDIAPAVRRITIEERPSFPPSWDPDERAVAGAYGERPPYNERSLPEVISDLETACADLAATLDTVEADGWTRSGRFDYGERSILDLARNAVHEGSHHLRDIERVLRQVRGRPADDDVY
ncbi:MAG TPA: DinB family protein [Acidimicrobiales bacterium]|nr:DinB family protein [Acidimicrobiales bacterium]